MMVRSSSYLTAMVIAATLAMGLGPARAQLPAEIEADMMARELMKAVEANDYQRIIKEISKIRKITPDLPDGILFFDANAKLKAKDHIGAAKAAESYLRRFGKSGERYADVLDIYAESKSKYEEYTSKITEEININAVKGGMGLYDSESNKSYFGIFDSSLISDKKRFVGITYISATRYGKILSHYEEKPCKIVINDDVDVSVILNDGKWKSGTVSTKEMVDEKSSKFHWNNKFVLDFSKIGEIKSIDLFNSRSGSKNFIQIIPEGYDGLPMRPLYKHNVSISNNHFLLKDGYTQFSYMNDHLILIPDSRLHDKFIASMNKLARACKALTQ
ncbi:hypothetical protein ACLKMW_26255 [Pseudaminobacter sp. NGMCC 1.201702]